MAEKVSFVDFETEAIDDRPRYPPRPVGVAIRLPGQRRSRYLAFGHPTGNNSTQIGAAQEVAKAYEAGAVSFHNGKFDEDVANVHMGLPILPWNRMHDTMVMAYLVDPHAKKIGLKELAESRLGILPTERDEVREWLIQHGYVNRANKKGWGAFISKAPGDLVGKYAEGDTDRTKLVMEDLLPEVQKAGMQGAYDRERQLIPVLLANERQGVHVDIERLRHDVELYTKALEKAERAIFKALDSKPFNLDSGEEVADALDRKFPGIIWPLTPGGARSTSKDALAEVLAAQPPQIYALFVYHATVTTCVRTFMTRWLATAEETGGLIHTQWNSVAQSEGGGTRTGRLSSTPNFQNIPTLKSRNFAKAIELWERYLKKLGYPPLPAVRSYIVADTKNDVLLDRDFSQQELRVLAHFEDGDMMQGFIDNPAMDLHEYAAEVISKATDLALTRKETKNIAFGLLYGMGLASLAELLGVSMDQAKRLKKAYLDTFPGIKDIQRELEFRSRNNLPMTTIGGRRYFCEPPKMINGRLREFGYKLFNYLIQGSSADVTKEAVLRYDQLKKHGRLLLTVHDQLVVCCPKKVWKSEMALLREAMEGIPLGAPLRSDGGVGYRWTELEDCE